MVLTDAKVRAAKPLDKSYKLTDGDGMHLMVDTNSSKYWRLTSEHGSKSINQAIDGLIAILKG